MRKRLAFQQLNVKKLKLNSHKDYSYTLWIRKSIFGMILQKLHYGCQKEKKVDPLYGGKWGIYEV